MAGPLPPEKHERIVELYKQGVGRNQIAKQVGCSWNSVTRIVNKAGGEFDRTQTKIGAAAWRADCAERRARLAAKLLANAENFADQVNEPHLVYNFGGKDNTYEEHMLNRPPTQALRDLSQAAAVSAKTSLELDRADQDPASEEKDLLARLGVALGIVPVDPVVEK